MLEEAHQTFTTLPPAGGVTRLPHTLAGQENLGQGGGGTRLEQGPKRDRTGVTEGGRWAVEAGARIPRWKE